MHKNADKIVIKKYLNINFKILVKIENWFVNLLFYFYKAWLADKME